MLKKIILAFMLMLALSAPAFATISSTNSRMDYTGNGAVDTYSYNFKIFTNTDLLVTVRDTDDVETTLTLTTDYTVTGVGSTNGGNVVLVNSGQSWLDGDGDLKTGYVLTVRRVVQLKQTTDIRNQGSFYPEIHENTFDKLVMMEQQQQDEIDRSLKLPETVDPSDFNTSFPASLVGNAGASIIVNDSGDGFTDGPTADDISGAAASAAAASASASAASSSASSAATSASTAQTAASSIINFWGGTVGGTADAITLTPSPALGAYAAGISYTFLATGTNTGAVTVAISGLTAKSIKTQSGAALTAGNITSGRVYTIVYDGTNFIAKELATPEDGVITNAKVNASAGIAYSKLNLTGAVLNADLAGSISDSKLSTISTAGKVSGAALTSLSSTPSGAGIIPVANLGSGTPSASTILKGDGIWGYSSNVQVFTASGTFTAPSGITKVYLSMVGGGGGAYGTSSGSGPGGAGGNWVLNYPYTVTPGNNYTVTIGAGGLGRIEGSRSATAGSSTSFDTITVAGGAVASSSGATTNPDGLDASTTTGGKYYQKGGAGGATSGTTGGGGGGTPFGAGANGGTSNNAGTSGSANTGTGGSGAGSSGNTGGDGGSGLVIVMY